MADPVDDFLSRYGGGGKTDSGASAPAGDDVDRFLSQHAPPSQMKTFMQGQQKPMSWLDRAGSGLKDIPVAVARGIGALDPDRERAARFEQMVRLRNQDIEQHTPEGFWGHLPRAIGQSAATLPLIAAAPEAVALTAGVGGGLAKAGEGGTGREIITDAALSAAGGKALQLGGGAIAKAITPEATQAARGLIDAGVNTTAGQTLGGFARGMERFAKKAIPGGKSIVESGEREAMESFNRATINHALAPLGEKLPKDVPVGHEGIEWLGNRASQAYDAVLPKLKPVLDDPLKETLSALKEEAAKLPTAAREEVHGHIDDIMERFAKGEIANGRDIKNELSSLGHTARTMSKSEVPSTKRAGRLFSKLDDALHDMLVRQHPEAALELTRADEAWANYLRVRDAAGRASSVKGVFSPTSLRAETMRQATRTERATGKGLMQKWASDAASVMPGAVPKEAEGIESLLHPATGLAAAGINSLSRLMTRDPGLARQLLAQSFTVNPGAVRGGMTLGSAFSPLLYGQDQP